MAHFSIISETYHPSLPGIISTCRQYVTSVAINIIIAGRYSITTAEPHSLCQYFFTVTSFRLGLSFHRFSTPPIYNARHWLNSHCRCCHGAATHTLLPYAIECYNSHSYATFHYVIASRNARAITLIRPHHNIRPLKSRRCHGYFTNRAGRHSHGIAITPAPVSSFTPLRHYFHAVPLIRFAITPLLKSPQLPCHYILLHSYQEYCYALY
jgi:hypothetical protein